MRIVDKKTWGRHLQQLRQRAGMSQSDLADAAELSVRSLQNWEVGRTGPQGIQFLLKLADALKVSLDELVGRGRRG